MPAHKWTAFEQPGTVHGSTEWFVYCNECGTEQDDDNKESECIAEDFDKDAGS